MGSNIDKLLEHDIDSINDDLPRGGISLKELIAAESPQYITRNGETSAFYKEEIAKLGEIVPWRDMVANSDSKTHRLWTRNAHRGRQQSGVVSYSASYRRRC